MSEKRLLIVGVGERVQKDVLPVADALAGRYALDGLFARTGRTLELAGRERLVEPLAALTRERMAACELVYLAVGKPAVPAVLAHLAELDPSRTDLLIETPVMLFKHLGHLPLLARFRNVWVGEDCSALPWFDLVRQAVERSLLGEPREVVFDRSAYRYHGVAMIKALLGGGRVRWGRRRSAGGGAWVELRLTSGARGRIREPRDYAAGHFVLSGTRGSLTDSPAEARGGRLLLEPLVGDGACRGFRLGELEVELDETERALVGPMRAGETVTARMEDMKRAGLYRLFRSVHAGRGAYPLVAGLDDMAVDYLLEKVRVYVATPLTSMESRSGRAFVERAMRVLGR